MMRERRGEKGEGLISREGGAAAGESEREGGGVSQRRIGEEEAGLSFGYLIAAAEERGKREEGFDSPGAIKWKERGGKEGKEEEFDWSSEGREGRVKDAGKRRMFAHPPSLCYPPWGFLRDAFFAPKNPFFCFFLLAFVFCCLLLCH